MISQLKLGSVSVLLDYRNGDFQWSMQRYGDADIVDKLCGSSDKHQLREALMIIAVREDCHLILT